METPQSSPTQSATGSRRGCFKNRLELMKQRLQGEDVVEEKDDRKAHPIPSDFSGLPDPRTDQQKQRDFWKRINTGPEKEHLRFGEEVRARHPMSAQRLNVDRAIDNRLKAVSQKLKDNQNQKKENKDDKRVKKQLAVIDSRTKQVSKTLKKMNTDMKTLEQSMDEMNVGRD